MAAACSTSGPRRGSSAPPPPPPPPPSPIEDATATSLPTTPAAPGEDAIADAYALWGKLRVNAEKAVVLAADDPSRGWLDRAIDSDGRALFLLLSRPEFEPYSALRGEIRARLLFVVKPPTPEDRREAIQFVDRGFAEILKRRGRPVPAPA
jgi:hypothetical protein